jgi:hypothetical protein
VFNVPKPEHKQVVWTYHSYLSDDFSEHQIETSEIVRVLERDQLLRSDGFAMVENVPRVYMVMVMFITLLVNIHLVTFLIILHVFTHNHILEGKLQ